MAWHEVIMLLGGMLFAMVNEINDTFYYFYSNYAGYMLVSMIVGCYTLCVLLKKKVQRVTFYFNISAVVLLLTFNLWLFPKVAHYLFLPKKDICMKAILSTKAYFYTLNETGQIEFVLIDNNVSKKLNDYYSIVGIPKYEYDQLPPVGSKIQICGELSPVGFSYAYIDTVP